MIRRPPRSTRTDTLFPYTTLFRSGAATPGDHALSQRADGRGIGAARRPQQSALHPGPHEQLPRPGDPLRHRSAAQEGSACRMKPRPKRSDEPSGEDEWLVTYSDALTLLSSEERRVGKECVRTSRS